jgi:hypothetical protein
MARKINIAQTVYALVINILSMIAFAAPLANNQTFTSSFAKFRLRIESILVAFANEKPLYFNHLASTRLHHRLQICQLNALTSLQVQAVSFEVCKERKLDFKSVSNIFFAALFANNQN